jgi:hypothetical protein
MSIASGYATSIYKFSPVALTTTGTIILASAGASNALLGTFLGCEYKDTTLGVYRVSNFWPASTAATEIVAWVTTDPDIIYEIQADGSLATANIGENANFAAGIGNGTAATGISSASLSASSSSTTAGQVRILGIVPYPDNASGDTYTKVFVQIAKHQFVNPASAGI